MKYQILKMENEFNKKRLEVVKEYLINDNKNIEIFSDEDLMAIYSCLLVKAKAEKKKELDKVKE